jgi:hypothetical protein
MERKSVKEEAGLTQAESVNELDTSREFESATVTWSSIPSKDNPLPILPSAHSGPFVRIPVFPLPEESEAVVPFPSSNFQCAISPGSRTADSCWKRAWISVLVKARLWTLTSSIKPLKFSPNWLAPIWRVPVVGDSALAMLELATATPFRYRVSVDPV